LSKVKSFRQSKVKTKTALAKTKTKTSKNGLKTKTGLKDYITDVFYINVIVVGQNIFQVWNLPHSVHSDLSYLFSTIIRVYLKA